MAKAKPKPQPATDPAPAPLRVGPSKEVVRLSEDLERLLKQDQLKAKVPAGMDKCPACGVAIPPTRVAKVRTHDDPLTGRRCDASQRPWAEFPGAKRAAPAPKPAARGKAKGQARKPKGRAKAPAQRRLRVRPAPRRSGRPRP